MNVKNGIPSSGGACAPVWHLLLLPFPLGREVSRAAGALTRLDNAFADAGGPLFRKGGWARHPLGIGMGARQKRHTEYKISPYAMDCCIRAYTFHMILAESPLSKMRSINSAATIFFSSKFNAPKSSALTAAQEESAFAISSRRCLSNWSICLER